MSTESSVAVLPSVSSPSLRDGLQVLWLLAFLAGMDGAILAFSDFQLASRTVLLALGATLLAFGLAWFYGVRRPEPRIAGMAWSGARLVLFLLLAGLWDTFLTGLYPLPWRDAALAAADHWLGLHWLPMYAWLQVHPLLLQASWVFYGSLGMELMVLIFLLNHRSLFGDSDELFWGFAFTALATIVIGILLPAAGAFVHYHLPIAAHTGYVAQMAALRDGALRDIHVSQGQGLVTFPSFHASLACLCAYAARHLRRWWPFALPWNLLVIASAPADGGHYFVDILAGILLALAVIALIRRLRSGPFLPRARNG
jgi:membrane-associated phospholipid phosphatase